MTASALERRVQMMVGRAIVTAVDDERGVQEVQVEILSDETQDGVEHLQPYGFAAHPKAGAEGVVLAAGGTRSHAVVIAVGDRRYRLKSLAEGEVALFDDLGQVIRLGREGVSIYSAAGVSIETSGSMSLTADHLTLSGSSIALATDNLSLGNGAALFAARRTDPATGGVITGGSTKVKIA